MFYFFIKKQIFVVYAAKNNLFPMGGSASGLLMDAVVNMRPKLWKGVVTVVPFVDVVTNYA